MKNDSYTYSIVLTSAEEGGFTVTVPALPGCVTEGDTYEEALENAREAIGLTLDCLKEFGESAPHETQPAFISSVTVPFGAYA